MGRSDILSRIVSAAHPAKGQRDRHEKINSIHFHVLLRRSSTMKFLGLVTARQYNRDLDNLRIGMAGALALAEGITIDELRAKATSRKEKVVAVKLGKGEEIAAMRKQLMQMEAEYAHIQQVEDGLTAIVDALPTGVTVSLDPLVYQVDEPTLEADEALVTNE